MSITTHCRSHVLSQARNPSLSYLKAKMMWRITVAAGTGAAMAKHLIDSLRSRGDTLEAILLEKMLVAARGCLCKEEREGRYYLVYDEVINGLTEEVKHVEISGCVTLADGSIDMDNRQPEFFTVYVFGAESLSIAVADFDSHIQASDYARAVSARLGVAILDRYPDQQRASE